MQSAAASLPLAARPARLLALHGWRTSAAVLQQQLTLSGMDVVLRPHARVTLLDAPHPARGPPFPDVQKYFQPPFYEWWDAVKMQAPTSAADGPTANGSVAAEQYKYDGFEASLALIEEELRRGAEQGDPVAGLLGFSQGATLAALVLGMQERGERFQDVPPLRCAVLISGGPSRDPAHAHLYTPHQHQQRQRQQLQSKHASHNPNGEQGASAAGSSQGSPHPQAAALHTAAAQTEHHTSPDGQGSTPSHGPLNQSAHTNGANGWNPGSSGGGGAEAAAGGTAAQDSHGHDRQPHHHHHHQHHRQDHAALLRPTCHLVGLADALRPRSEELVGYCHQPLVLRHRQGHVVPRLADEAKEQLAAFLVQHLAEPMRADVSAH